MEEADSELIEFKQEAEDLLAEAEAALLKLNEANFQANYSIIFRTFHSLKGGAGMLGLKLLQDHMHKVENLFQTMKSKNNLNSQESNFFLAALDTAKDILNDKKIKFLYEINDAPHPEVKTYSSPNINKKNEEIFNPLIYIIDDEKDIVEILSGIVQDAGYKYMSFTDPVEAMSELKKNPPQLVLTDVSMPKMQGLEVLRSVSEFNKSIPVIFISGMLNSEILIDAVNSNISFVVEKPVDDKKLKYLIEVALEKYEILELLQKSVEIVLFQFKDLYQYLMDQNKKPLADILKVDVMKLIKSQYAIMNKVNKTK